MFFSHCRYGIMVMAFIFPFFAIVTEPAVAIMTDPEKFNRVSVRHCD